MDEVDIEVFLMSTIRGPFRGPWYAFIDGVDDYLVSGNSLEQLIENIEARICQRA